MVRNVRFNNNDGTRTSIRVMDVRLSKELTEIIKDDVVVKSVENTDDDFKNNMYELCGDNDLMLEALRITAKKMKPISYTFVEVK